MARLRIYGVARTRAFGAIWMAKELGLDYEHVPIETGPAVADLNVAAVTSRAISIDLAATPRLADWLRRCLDRPAARDALKLRGEADVATPAEITRTIARMNRL